MDNFTLFDNTDNRVCFMAQVSNAVLRHHTRPHREILITKQTSDGAAVAAAGVCGLGGVGVWVGVCVCADCMKRKR